jgi:single-strand DNA-binding protein
MVNRVVLVGRLTRDPELRTTTTGKSVCSFTIAVNKRSKPTDGSPDADFFNVTAWDRTADFVTNYLTKGRLVAVDGRLQSRKYTTNDGQNREVVEIVAENIQGLDRPRDDQAGGGAPVAAGGAPAPRTAAPSPDEYDPFADD